MLSSCAFTDVFGQEEAFNAPCHERKPKRRKVPAKKVDLASGTRSPHLYLHSHPHTPYYWPIVFASRVACFFNSHLDAISPSKLQFLQRNQLKCLVELVYPFTQTIIPVAYQRGPQKFALRLSFVHTFNYSTIFINCQ